MRKESVLELKSAVLTSLRRQTGQSRRTQTQGLASPNLEDRLAVGYSHLKKGSYRLELRVQRRSGAAYRLAEEFKKKARQEANIEEVPLIEIPLGSNGPDFAGLKALTQYRRPLHIGLSVGHADGPAGTLGAFVSDDDGTEGVPHAVHHGKLFTHSAGLVAAHPVAHHLAHQSELLKWLLRREAFLRFGFDPMNIFGGT